MKKSRHSELHFINNIQNLWHGNRAIFIPMNYTPIDLETLKNLITQPDVLLLDVREKTEFHDFNIGGTNVPSHEIMDHLDEMALYRKIIVVCSNGLRSRIIANVLTKKLPKCEILHLEEGIL